MALFADFVLQTANNPGTGTFSLIAPPTGRRTFVAGVGAGQTFYIAHDGTSWEEGIGTVTAGTPDTLSRDTVTANSLGTTAKINFTSTVNVYNDIPAARALSASADNATIPFASRRLATVGAATATSDAPRYDQVAWQVRSSSIFVSTVATVVFSLPTDCSRYRLEVQDTTPSVSAPPYIRFSYDGGSTYASGATEYGTILNGSAVATTYAQIGPTVSGPVFGSAEWNALGIHFGVMDFVGINGATLSRTYGGMNTTTSGVATHVLFGFVSASVVQGRLRLLGSMT